MNFLENYISVYLAFMRLFTGVTPHVHNEHILGLEWLFLSATFFPSTYKYLSIAADMLLVYMLQQIKE